MDEIKRMLKDIALPEVAKVAQTFSSTEVEAPYETVMNLLESRIDPPAPGSTIAITCGSRGIHNYQLLVKAAVDWLKSKGAKPILIPAMGSHGGATAEGQERLLAHYGITEENMGAPVVSSMETVEVARTSSGLPVYIDKNAAQADGILLLNRVKPHTSFRGTYESGLFKMMAIGLGKQKGAEMTHFLRYDNMAKNIQEVGSLALANLNVIGGVATIENGYDKMAELHVLRKEEIPEKEPELLKRAWEYMPRILLDDIDVLIVKEIGKNISGTGMDTNLVGRYHTTAASGGPRVSMLGVLGITSESEGNANGMGLADFVTRRVADEADYAAIYINVLTSTAPASAKLPVVLENDEMVLKACAKLAGRVDYRDIRLVVIENTRDIGTVYMSQAALDACVAPENCCRQGEFMPLPFDEEGRLQLF